MANFSLSKGGLYSNGKRIIFTDGMWSFVTGDFTIRECSVDRVWNGGWNSACMREEGCAISLRIHIPKPAYSEFMIREVLEEEIKKLVGGIASASNEELMLQIHKNMENRNA